MVVAFACTFPAIIEPHLASHVYSCLRAFLLITPFFHAKNSFLRQSYIHQFLLNAVMADMAEQTAQSQAFAAALSTVAAHPLTQQQLDDNQSDMSSALTDPTNYADLWELADKILDFYNPTSSSDKTCTVIRAFRQILSKHGQVALMADIKTIGRDQSKLRLFARHLINTILKPSKQSLHSNPGCMLIKLYC